MPIVLGLVAALCGLATVVSQAMIYASLKPIRQWHNNYVLPNFLLLSLYSGAVWLAASPVLAAGGAAAAISAIVLAVVSAAVKLVYWRSIDTAPPAATIESATGLGAIGKVRPLEAPHTEENYLLREMGYEIGRKHAAKLRLIALAIGFVVPVLFLAIGLAVAGMVCAAIAALAALIGIYIERWLFFAEATHTVTLYYDRRHEAPRSAAA